MTTLRLCAPMAAALLALGGCTAADEEALPGLFTPAVTEVVIEVDYEAGAEPAAGSVPTFGEIWDFTRTNLDALFETAPKHLTVPTDLADMEALGALAGEDYSTEAILAIAEAHRGHTDSVERRSFYVVFLDGYLLDQGVRQDNVLGVSIGGTSVVAMFAPVATSASLPRLVPFVEQSVLVHELGHAVGLVDNGLEPTTAHHDAAHAAHCSSDACVMYWQYEGASEIVSFVQQYVATSSAVVFGQECLADARGAASGG